MNADDFKMCIDCANKQSDPKLPKGKYYCPYVQGVLPDCIVQYDIDAADCVKKGVFREIIYVENKYTNQ